MYAPVIQLGSSNVLSNGTVVSRGDQVITFFPLPPPSNSYKVEIEFHTEEGKEPSISHKVVDSYFKITLININTKSPDSGNSTAIYVANHQGRKILFDFVTSVVGVGSIANRVLHYTFFDGGPV